VQKGIVVQPIPALEFTLGKKYNLVPTYTTAALVTIHQSEFCIKCKQQNCAGWEIEIPAMTYIATPLRSVPE